MRFWRSTIDLNETNRAARSNQLELRGDTWVSTGNDPYIVYTLDDQLFIGPWLLDLIIAEPVSFLRPRIYVQCRDGFSEFTATYMRQVSSRRYTLRILLPARCRLIRLDPADTSDCSFRFVTFEARPIFLSTFVASAMRDGDGGALARVGLLQCARRIFDDLRTNAVSFDTRDDAAAFDKRKSYATWIDKVELPSIEPELIRERCRGLASLPLISILMPVYDTAEDVLNTTIQSVVDQIYPNWELCIADDASTKPWVRPTLERWQQQDHRIKLMFRPQNGHISEATNSAFSMATSEWIALLDHDDALAPHALAEVAAAINVHPQAEIIYSDEDKCDDQTGERYDPYHKPDWSYDLFTGQNYLNHLTVHRAANIRDVGGWRVGFEGSQDYDLNLRIIERIDQSRIVHIPKILYHWRAVAGSVARETSTKSYAHTAAQRALAEHVERMAYEATVLPAAEGLYHRLRRRVPREAPLISLIIPTRDKVGILRTCVDSILKKTDYPNYEILIVDNNSVESATAEYFSRLTAMHKNVRVLPYAEPFNFSAINNFAVQAARGELVGLINNDIEVINRDWLTEMASHAIRPEVGCVGAKLYYPNETVQHAGVILGVGGVAGHSHKYYKRGAAGYFGRLLLVQNVSAVTAACLLVKRQIYLAAGGFDEQNLTVAFNDVDFCLRVRELGYVNVWTPFAELYHHESLSRGSDAVAGAVERFQQEIFYMQSRWKDALRTDPYYSVNLTLEREDFSLGFHRD